MGFADAMLLSGGNLPIFDVVDCRWLLSMLKTSVDFLTVSTSAMSLRGLAYSARGRAEFLTDNKVNILKHQSLN